MPDAVRVEVLGVPALNRALDDVARDLADPDHALSDVSRDMARRASDYAPKLTGTLARSVVPSGRPGYASASTSLVYAGPVNYGRPDHNIATHFMERALAASEGPAREQIDRGISTTIQREGLA